MENILRIICIAAIALEFIMLLLSMLFIKTSAFVVLRRIWGAFGCIVAIFFVAALVFGILDVFGIRLDFLLDISEDKFYVIYDDILIWAVLGFGAVISVFSLVVGFLPMKKTQRDETPVPQNLAVKEDIVPERVSEDIFKGLESEKDIDAFLGGEDIPTSDDTEQKIQTLKKLEKLLK